jgi:hypothetical protein
MLTIENQINSITLVIQNKIVVFKSKLIRKIQRKFPFNENYKVPSL